MGGLPLESPAGLRVAVLSNITLEPYFTPLMESHFGGGTLVSRIPYGEHREPVYAQELKNAGLLVVWLNLEALAPDLLYSESESGELPAGLPELLQELYKGLRSASQAKILWFSFLITIPIKNLYALQNFSVRFFVCKKIDLSFIANNK